MKEAFLMVLKILKEMFSLLYNITFKKNVSKG